MNRKELEDRYAASFEASWLAHHALIRTCADIIRTVLGERAGGRLELPENDRPQFTDLAGGRKQYLDLAEIVLHDEEIILRDGNGREKAVGDLTDTDEICNIALTVLAAA